MISLHNEVYNKQEKFIKERTKTKKKKSDIAFAKIN